MFFPHKISFWSKYIFTIILNDHQQSKVFVSHCTDSTVCERILSYGAWRAKFMSSGWCHHHQSNPSKRLLVHSQSRYYIKWKQNWNDCNKLKSGMIDLFVLAAQPIRHSLKHYNARCGDGARSHFFVCFGANQALCTSTRKM